MTDRSNTIHFNRRRILALGTIALLAPSAAFRPTTMLASASVTQPDQLMLGFLDGNGYVVINDEMYPQYIDGVPQVELWEGIDPFLQSVQLNDILVRNTTLKQDAEYYPTGVYQRVNIFPSAESAVAYLAGIYEVVEAELAATGIGTNLAPLASLPDHDQAITGWTLDSIADDGGLLPTIRYLAQIDTIVVSVTVASQNPDRASAAAPVLLEALITAVRTDTPPAPMLFPV